MNRNFFPRPLVFGFKITLVMLVCTSSTTARAELDFEYAQALFARNDPSFATDDLVEHYIDQLSRNSGTKIDAKLVKAEYRRHQAAQSITTDQSKKLIGEAESLYREILSGDKNYRHYDLAIRESDAIIADKIGVMRKAAQELEKTDPKGAEVIRREASDAMEGVAAKYKAAVEATFEKFTQAKKTTDIWKKQHKDQSIPKDLCEALNKTGDAWIVADKHYLAARVGQLECYSDTDKAKKPLAEELANYCKARIDDEDLLELPVVTLWYSYMQGRIFAEIEDEGRASEAWKSGLENLNIQEMNESQKKQIIAIRKMIVQSLVKMKMRAKKYADVEEIILGSIHEPEFRNLFEEYNGKELMIDYVRAMTLPAESTGEYERAASKLRELIAKETVHGIPGTWANRYAGVLAEILQDARSKGLSPQLSARDWYNAAHGCFVMGQSHYRNYFELKSDSAEKRAERQEQFEKACSEYQIALGYYRHAITQVRQNKSTLLDRISLEPNAWFEMGLCYLRMKQYYESIIAYRALRDSFLPEKRAKWIPDFTRPDLTPELRQAAKSIQSELANLDRPREGLVAKASAYLIYAIDTVRTEYHNPDNNWVEDFPRRQGNPASPGENPQYGSAKTDMDIGRGFADAARKMPDAKQAESDFMQAIQKFEIAAIGFLAVKPTIPEYEIALYQAGRCYTLAQNLWAEGKIASKPRAEQLAQARELGMKALDAFQKYGEIQRRADRDPKVKTRRQTLAGIVLLARNTIYVGNADWPAVVKSADEYIQWESAHSTQESSIDIALLNKFRALIELAAQNDPPGCSPFLQEAERTLRRWHQLKPDDRQTYAFMLDSLSYRNNTATFKVEALNKVNPGSIPADIEKNYRLKRLNFRPSGCRVRKRRAGRHRSKITAGLCTCS